MSRRILMLSRSVTGYGRGANGMVLVVTKRRLWMKLLRHDVKIIVVSEPKAAS